MITEIKEQDNIDNSLISETIIRSVIKKLKILYQIIFIDFHKFHNFLELKKVFELKNEEV